MELVNEEVVLQPEAPADALLEIDSFDMPDQTDTRIEAQELLVSTEMAYAAIKAMSGRISQAKTIDKATARDIHVMTVGLESMDQHFAKYPVNSYTNGSSTTNLQVTCENLLQTAAKKLWELAKAIWKMIVDAVKWLFNTVTGNGVKFKTVRENAMKMQKKQSKPAEASYPFAPRQAQVVSKLNESTFALWLGWGESYLNNQRPMQYCYDLFKIEEALVAEVANRMDKIAEVVDSPSLTPELVEGLLNQPYVAVDAYTRLVDTHAEQGKSAADSLNKTIHTGVMKILSPGTDKSSRPQQAIESRAALYDWIDGVQKIKGFLSICSLVNGNEYKRISTVVDYTQDKVLRELQQTPVEGDVADNTTRELLVRLSEEMRAMTDALYAYTQLITHYYKHSSIAIMAVCTDWGFGFMDQVAYAGDQQRRENAQYGRH